MSRKAYAWIAGVVGAGVATWYWRAARHPRTEELGEADEIVTVIFDNTPTPSGVEF
jgi:hypothetical protein